MFDYILGKYNADISLNRIQKTDNIGYIQAQGPIFQTILFDVWPVICIIAHVNIRTRNVGEY